MKQGCVTLSTWRVNLFAFLAVLAFNLLYTPFSRRDARTRHPRHHPERNPVMMTAFTSRFWNDEAGFVVSAELVLVATIAILAMIVGLSEIAISINNELEDVAAAFGSMNQSFQYKGVQGHNGYNTVGSSYLDKVDFCDNDCNIVPGEIAGERTDY
jgi:Flp pilus assembly pilin Flp